MTDQTVTLRLWGRDTSLLPMRVTRTPVTAPGGNVEMELMLTVQGALFIPDGVPTAVVGPSGAVVEVDPIPAVVLADCDTLHLRLTLTQENYRSLGLGNVIASL